MRDGGDLVGWGMASGVWDAFQVPITVRIRLTANGHAEVACATSDIGTGTYTIMAQVAADMLGLPLDAVSVKLGDSTLPQSPVEGGSWIAASVSNGIAGTADAIRHELLRLAAADSELALGRRRPGRGRARRRQAGEPARRRARGLHRRCHAAGRRGPDRAGDHHQPRRRQHARPQHPFRGLRRGQGRRAARRDPRHPHRQRRGGRAHPEHQDGGQPDPRRRRLGNRHGAARGNRDRPPPSAAS